MRWGIIHHPGGPKSLKWFRLSMHLVMRLQARISETSKQRWVNHSLGTLGLSRKNFQFFWSLEVIKVAEFFPIGSRFKCCCIYLRPN